MKLFQQWLTNRLKASLNWRSISNQFGRNAIRRDHRFLWAWSRAGLNQTSAFIAPGILIFSFLGCAGDLQSKISINLNTISQNMTIAILPVETTGKNQQDAARLFRQSLYANLEQSQLRVMERYLVDGLLEQNNISQPEQFKAANPILLGEILGADAVLLITMNKMDRTYAVVHSSIELGVSIKMIDTRTGEILWIADQTETEYEGIAKIPTGITAAALGPVQFVTNKVNLHRLAQKMTEKLTTILKKPETAHQGEIFESLMVVASAAQTIKTFSAPNQEFSSEAQPIPIQVSLPIQVQEPEIIFTIQVGAYKTQRYAKKMIAALESKGYKVYLRHAQIGQQTLYKVHIGKFETREEAIQYGNQLAHREQFKYFITQFPSD